ncbi:hypothetical protein QBC35DRAFT_416904 [Podospora australis]|uniref:Uncharacterized protein n=1 Tax=Podospora australis TaxID=1536484 RepID=A0AAN7AEQ2_9PEZI|nr:hypothetical protein QBC35DRAFT_416904 [Podospora australis]
MKAPAEGGTEMTDHDASPPSHVRPRRAARHSNNVMEDDTTENTFLNVVSPESTLVPPLSDDIDPLVKTSLRSDNRHAIGKRQSVNSNSRGHKSRSSGAFLLADPLTNAHHGHRDRERDARASNGGQPDRRYRNSLEQPYKSQAVQHGKERSYPRTFSAGSQAQTLGIDYGSRDVGGSESGSTSTTLTKRERDSLAGSTAVGSEPRSSITQLDMESAQIVNMALNLSESRRLATRRNVTQPTPPRLAPLPDSATGGSLRQHLQQQRRISRTISPRPDRSPRVGSGRILSPLQSPFEPDGSYRYHFSQSTLARAQKAKEYLDLMCQYRRVLDLLPPLEPSRSNKPPTASPPETPNGSAPVFKTYTNDSETKIGRPYNPLQYIRNRKVRARERKAIDGEGQGFNDVPRVSEWIDEVAKWVATGQARTPGNPALPPFAGAQAAAAFQNSPPSNNSRSTVATAKPKRPRVDWVIDPADMIADVYWLELDDNKKFVEDRHWRRVFPQGPDSSRPQPHDDMPRMTTPGSNKDSSDSTIPNEKAPPDPPPAKHEGHDHAFTSARDRAQQKLRALKGHHRQASSVNNRDFLRIRRGSVSESSDTDSDRRRRRAGTVNARSVLEKQMEEMIAREQRAADAGAPYDHYALRMKFASINPMTPERDLLQNNSPDASKTNSHRRAHSHADLSEVEGKTTGTKRVSPPTQFTGRSSLEVPSRSRRLSVDYDTSQPNSPVMRPVREGGLVPAIGMDLSPMNSRPSSPSRNPLTKVKSMFRERSKERTTDNYASAEEPESAILTDKLVATPDLDWSAVSSPERRPSRSPLGRIVTRGTDSSHKSHKSTSSAKLRPEDMGTGLRSLFRGPRIDTVLRSGVSKISDMMWKKDVSGGGDDNSSTSSSSDSEAEAARGRSRGPRGWRRGHGREPSTQNGKSLLETMPQFVSTVDHAQPSSNGDTLLPHPPAQPLSRRSSRFDLLKPPRIDIQNASPSISPPPLVDRQRGAAGISDNQEPQKKDHREVDTTDVFDTAVSTFRKQRQFSTASSAAARHWSIADRGGMGPPTRTSVNKRDIARLRALLLSSGIHALEVDRRAQERKLLTSPKNTGQATHDATTPAPGSPFTFSEIIKLCPDPETQKKVLARPVPQTEVYMVAARALSSSIENSAMQYQSASDRFSLVTAPALERRVEELRFKVAGELTELTHRATDEADEANHDLVAGQRLKVKRVVDVIEKMLRRRRRRFRWVRRAGWLGVEWALVGFMWWVWFVVTVMRFFLGLVGGVLRGVRWLLWL